MTRTNPGRSKPFQSRHRPNGGSDYRRVGQNPRQKAHWDATADLNRLADMQWIAAGAGLDPAAAAVVALVLSADLVIPEHARGIVLFAHGSGSGRLSPRNRFVASALNDAGLATLLADLLTADEERLDERTAELRFDIELLTRRLTGIVDWSAADLATRGLAIGLFGASTGAAAAICAAAARPALVRAVVSRGGRVDLAAEEAPHASAPTLLIVGAADREVLALNRSALPRLGARPKDLTVVEGATHLFEEPGALEEVAALATAWFLAHLSKGA